MRAVHPRVAALIVAMVIVLAGVAFYAYRGYNPQALGIMPGPVQEVLGSPTLSGHDIAWNILTLTGNQSDVGHWTIPGNYNFGPVGDAGDNTWFVTLYVPIKMSGIAKRLGYTPLTEVSNISSELTEQTSTVSYEDYVDLTPLPSQSFDRLYFDPNNHTAVFAFKVDPYGQIIDESWDSVAVNS